jgi:hypothetical protein
MKTTIKTLFFLFVIPGFFSCVSSRHSSYNPQEKIPADKLKQDFILLKKILEANHTSLYWYSPKDSIDAYFNQAYDSITDSLTETQFPAKWVGSCDAPRARQWMTSSSYPPLGVHCTRCAA